MITLRRDLEWQLKVALERKSMETNDDNPLPPLPASISVSGAWSIAARKHDLDE